MLDQIQNILEEEENKMEYKYINKKFYIIIYNILIFIIYLLINFIYF